MEMMDGQDGVTRKEKHVTKTHEQRRNYYSDDADAKKDYNWAFEEKEDEIVLENDVIAF